MARLDGPFFWGFKKNMLGKKPFKYQEQLGITLMELLITIAIIAILAAVGVPMYSGNIRAAKNADAQNTLKSIYLMEKNYFAENYCYYITPGTGNQTASINQYVMGSTTPTTGPITVGTDNDFYFYITAGTVGSGGSCTGSNSNDYVAYAQSRTDSTIIYSINQLNVKTGF
ncbi:prepilin-type N-terminal cleavage/methylation domain-containing protein [Polynucleobacter sp. MWH-Braz-FAM2G]|uniref:prepilin-type N-terminal cleavage/methylation domain-containing protein n=1 Tax=Polynucleobacter sp. MWH-Braz-FAM2G TaxID=1855883 RepID=UPI001BFD9015|nr:prepilin-type N-terminal cleavage/methylation domain-containing protein [Polynucleobacter sp. MWH-Braz-FAM2G]QWD89936.1 prepilin-type N-terminal cleavage/methylation domain-containing protein [Polynucleobacter sp. MWH-Braz-FAM2G]